MLCRRQSKRNNGALAESGRGALKQTELLHIKTDILRLHNMCYLKNIVIMLEKRDIQGKIAQKNIFFEK